MQKNFLIILLLASAEAHSDVAPESQHEVQYLIDFVSSSSCQIIRNGDTHNGPEAVEHIQDKYDYYRDDIQSTEQFIEYSATKSMLSGNFYLVKCANAEPVKTKDWLLQELKNYRLGLNAQPDQAGTGK